MPRDELTSDDVVAMLEALTTERGQQLLADYRAANDRNRDFLAEAIKSYGAAARLRRSGLYKGRDLLDVIERILEAAGVK